MKKVTAFLCGLLMAFMMTLQVYADDIPSISTTDGGADESETIVVNGNQPGGGDTELVSITRETIDGVPYITKIYKLAQGADIAGLTASFEQDGFLFTKHDALTRQEKDCVESITVSQTETLESERKEIADIVAAAEPVLLYSENGYTGALQLDRASIKVEENGTSTYSYRVEDVREYTNLDRNDAAYVPKTVLKNGATLQLENIEWVVMGQHPVDGRMVPNLFKAIATYAGTATGSRANGYTATLTYSGVVEKATPGECIYTIIFRGEAIAASEAKQNACDKQSPEEKAGSGSLFVRVLLILICLAGFALAGVSIVRHIIHKRRNPAEGDFDDDDYDDFEEPDYMGEPRQQVKESRPEPQQVYPQEEFSIDALFDEEGFFNE